MTCRVVKKIPADEYRKMCQYLNGTILMGEDDTISITIPFTAEIEMDIKICGSDNGLPWTEAVLFRNGSEVCCSEAGEDILGTWTLSEDKNNYTAFIEA